MKVNEVLEVLPYQAITPVPKSNTTVLGIINFRGEILPVIDFSKKLNMEATSPSGGVIVVLEIVINGLKVFIGILVDRVNDVFEIALKDIRQMPEIGLQFKAEFLSGIFKSDDRFISLLDMHKVFSHEEIAQMNNNITTSES
jgi:purine-binding chemotaxis protein CheW